MPQPLLKLDNVTKVFLTDEVETHALSGIHLQIEKDGGGRVQEHVTRLSRFGLTTAAIAEILGTTAGTVAVAKSRVKKKGR